MAVCELCAPHDLPEDTTVVCHHSGESGAVAKHVVITNGAGEHPLLDELVQSLVEKRLAEEAGN